MEIITVVNENDVVIGAKDREELAPNEIYRVASLWVEDGKGNVLLSQRALSLNHDQGKWMAGVAVGTVADGETYEETIVRETKEEVGLTINPSDLMLIKVRFNDGKNKFFTHKFKVTMNVNIENLKIEKKEIASVKWFDKSKLSNLISTNPEMFISSIIASTKDLL